MADTLVMVAKAEGFPILSRAMRRMQDYGTCDFCNDRVVYNRANIASVKAQGNKPVLVCVACHAQGAHLKQGYRKA